MFSENIERIHQDLCRYHNERNDVLLPNDDRRATIVSRDHVDDPGPECNDNSDESVSSQAPMRDDGKMRPIRSQYLCLSRRG